jgi:cytochrome c553
MKHAHLALAILSAGLIAGCANPMRSRDLNNPKVPAMVMAQQVCSNCHGVAGSSVSPNFPNLAAQTPAYIVAQLKGFKSHGRQDPAGFEYMWGISRSLTDEQIDGLAAYYASQTLERQPSEGDPNRRAAGKSIFLEGLPAQHVPPCMTCHGDAAQGNAGFPRLAGQHADYVAKQLVVFQRTMERRPEGEIMEKIVHELNAEDIKNVAAYVQALGNP